MKRAPACLLLTLCALGAAQAQGLSGALGGSPTAAAASTAPIDTGTPPEGYEVKVLIEPDHFPRLLTALGWLNEDLRRREVWFLDTPDLQLLDAGVILRARQEEDDLDLTVKLRGALDFASFVDLVPRDDFKTEIDVIGAKRNRSASYVRERDETFDPDDPLEEFSNRQLRFLEDQAQLDVKALSGLRAFGPIRTIKREHGVPGLADELVLEHWTLADGTVLVELSATAEDAVGARALEVRLGQYLTGAGVTPAAPSSKTRQALRALLP